MLLEFISLASGINFIFLAIVVYRTQNYRLRTVKLLIGLLLCMSTYSNLVFFHYYAVEKNNLGILASYYPIDGILLSALSPCLYFYIRAMLQLPKERNIWMLFLHVFPFIPFMIFNAYFLTLSPTARIEWLIHDFQYGTLENNVLNVVLYLQILIYLIVCLKLVQKHATKQLNCTDKQIINSVWLKKYLIANLIFMPLSSIVCFYLANERANIIIGQLAMDVQFVYLFFKCISLASENGSKKQQLINAKVNKCDENLIVQHIEILNKFMIESKPYLNENYNIQSLSVQTNIPLYQLSNILNCKLQKSFPDFINEYRIEVAKSMLLSMKAETATIESIAFDCGFGSKSSFNRAFKKFSNNFTPTQYIQQTTLN